MTTKTKRDRRSLREERKPRHFHGLQLESLEARNLLATWTQQDHLFAFPAAIDPEAGAQHGLSVAVDGDWMIVGAYREDAGGLTDAGAAYIYHRDDGGTPGDTHDDAWLPQAKLTAGEAATSTSSAARSPCPATRSW